MFEKIAPAHCLRPIKSRPAHPLHHCARPPFFLSKKWEKEKREKQKKKREKPNPSFF
jgi:hypothetical protein